MPNTNGFLPPSQRLRPREKRCVGYSIAMHTVAVIALDGVLAFDLATPVEVFGRASLPDGRRAYGVRVCASEEEVDAGVFAMRAPWGLDALVGADTIIVPGWPILRRRSPRMSSGRCGRRRRVGPGSRPSASVRSPWPRPGCWTGCAPPRTGLRRGNSPAGTPASMWTTGCSSSTTAGCSPRPGPRRAWTFVYT